MRRLLLVLSALVATALPARAQRGRPVILIVHGRGMLGRDTAATRKLWLDGLRSGAATMTRAPTIEDGDVRVVWYADVLDPKSSEGCDYAPEDPRAQRDARSDAGLKTVASFAGGLFDMLSSVAGDNDSGIELRALAADAAFLGDAHKRCGSEARLAAAIDRARVEGRPVILVAHSLGSLVAYDYLTTRSDTGLVRRFVTIGSMVGARDLRQLLIGGDSTDVLAMPSSVADWVNVHHGADPLATPLPIGRDILTSPPADEPDPHEMLGYLRGSAASKEILSAWCLAISGVRPSGCKEIVPK
jgi:pimeloyl-ACP methyl ester carboxylesterase